VQLPSMEPLRVMSEVDPEISGHDSVFNLSSTSGIAPALDEKVTESSATLTPDSSCVRDVQATTPLPATTTAMGSESSTTVIPDTAPLEVVIPEGSLSVQPILEPENIALEVAGQQESAVTLCTAATETGACEEVTAQDLHAGLAPYAVAYDWPMHTLTWNPLASQLRGEEVLLLSSNCGVNVSAQEFYHSTVLQRAVERHDPTNSTEPFQMWGNTLNSEVEGSREPQLDDGNWETLRTQARDAVEEAFVIAVGRRNVSTFEGFRPP